MDAAERHALRRDLLNSIDAAWIGAVAATRKVLAANDRKLKNLQFEIDHLMSQQRLIAESSVTVWNQAMDRLRLPVEGGTVVPATLRMSPEELILLIGDDEFFVIYATGKRHHYGPTVDGKGARDCYECGHRGFLEPVDLAVISDDVPDSVWAALKQKLPADDEPEDELL